MAPFNPSKSHTPSHVTLWLQLQYIYSVQFISKSLSFNSPYHHAPAFISVMKPRNLCTIHYTVNFKIAIPNEKAAFYDCLFSIKQLVSFMCVVGVRG